ncbi:MAG: YIP1 family protein, partial [Thermoflexales bacterium]|nr:YIP1 family protein [Thermoflexales bacterium]
MDFNAMLNRVIRAVKLEAAFYNEAEADTSLNQEALMVVVIVSVLSAIGSFLANLITGNMTAAIFGLIWGVIWGVVGYYLWAYLTHFIGTKLFGGTADVGELLRTLGYASAPQALGVLAFIPCVGALPALAGAIWALVAGVVAVREALDFDNTK